MSQEYGRKKESIDNFRNNSFDNRRGRFILSHGRSIQKCRHISGFGWKRVCRIGVTLLAHATEDTTTAY
jgi:hypothetical protein